MADVAGHMEPIRCSSLVLSYHRGSGGGVWSCLGTVRSVSLLFVDMWSRAAYCRPDVGTHSQLSWEDTDVGPSVSTSNGSRQLCVIPDNITHCTCLKGIFYGCWCNFIGMHNLKKRVWGRLWMRSMSWCVWIVYQICPSCVLPCRAHINTPDTDSASPQCPYIPTRCSNFATTTAPKPLRFHNEFSQSDYSVSILLSVIITQALKLKTFVSYYFNRVISTSPWWSSPSSVIINLIE